MLGFGDALTIRGEGGIMDGSPISGLDDLVDAVMAPWGRTPEGRGSVTQWSRARTLVADFCHPSSAIFLLCDFG